MCLFDYGFLRAYANKGTAVSYGSFFPNVLGNLHTVLHSGYINLCAHQQCKKVPFSLNPLLHFIVSRYFDDGRSDQCEVISHCGFDLHFSNHERC